MKDQNKLNAPREPIQLPKPLSRAKRRFLSFLICAAILVAAFAVSGAWMKRAGGDFLNGWGSFLGGKDDPPSADTDESGETDREPEPPESSPADKTEDATPSGGFPVVSLDLSCSEYGRDYICNETGYRPNLQALREIPSETKSFDPKDGPVVLVLHTHASEAYRADADPIGAEVIGDTWYSDDPSRTVVAVGSALCQALNKNGIPAIHCAEMHGEGGTLRGSYADAAECIGEYLKRYPTIQYVIDIHRDGILDGNGTCVRTLAKGSGAPMAQAMAVVGTDGNGTAHPNWNQNLSLALRLRDGLEATLPTVSRPIFLRNATYNQEAVPNALLLEIGSAGNTVDEAIRTAELVGKTLATLLLGG